MQFSRENNPIRPIFPIFPDFPVFDYFLQEGPLGTPEEASGEFFFQVTSA